jgi:PAS domain S-box-containing protein
MLEFFRGLFGTDFMPHLYCLRSDPGVLWLQVLSDLAIALAYFAIPFVLLEVVRKRKDILFRRVAVLFVVFIAACGTTHLLAVWTIWVPMYRLEGLAKAATAIFSVITALALVRLRPVLLKLPSVAEFEAEIRERRLAEERAVEKEERLRNFVESVQDYAMYMVDPEGAIQSWNSGAERMTGYSADEIIGHNCSRFLSPEDVRAGKAEESLRIVKETGRFEGESRLFRKDGSPFLAHLTMRPLLSPSGNLRGFSMVTRDTTESHESETRFQALLEAVPDAIVAHRLPDEIAYLNSRAEALFGYGRAELLGRSADILVPERFRNVRRVGRQEMFRTLFATGVCLSGEYVCINRDGREFEVEASVSPLETPDGPVILAAVRDITDRRLAEEATREREERFRSFVDGVEDYAIYMLDSRGNVETWNHGAQRMKGYTAEEIVGQNFETFYTPEDRAQGKPQEALRTATETGLFRGEGWRMRKDGSRFLADVTMRPLRDSQGELRGFSKVTRDITESRDLETRFQVLLEAARTHS